MRIAFVQTYPVYHDYWSTDQWLALQNRDKWMPAVVSEMGHEVELWAVDRSSTVLSATYGGSAAFVVRLFRMSGGGGKSKRHFSDEMVAHCAAFDPDLCVLKGVDGGAGIRLIERYLRHAGKPFVFVIGGKPYTAHVPRAMAVLYECQAQREMLAHPRRLWHRSVAPDRLIRLPKTVDLERFRPMPEVVRQWDVLLAGRLVAGLKNYDALAALPAALRLAVAGGGPQLDRLRAAYPAVSWLGQVPHDQMPELLNRTRLFFFPGLRDFYPRVLAEAAACGVPSVAFEAGIGPDVLPPECGERVAIRNAAERIEALLTDTNRLSELTRSSRAFAEREHDRSALVAPIRSLLALEGAARGASESGSGAAPGGGDATPMADLRPGEDAGANRTAGTHLSRGAGAS